MLDNTFVEVVHVKEVIAKVFEVSIYTRPMEALPDGFRLLKN